ncbi:hypothetical protein KW790_03010 [Candidatus Parcubacteria bacterium]|nr:hypothetical protein [Candidatus Parcubacteria bacterium]
MKTFTEQKFDIPELKGISKKSVEEHLGLYAGYVKNFGALNAEMSALMPESEKHMHAISELLRRLSFEFGGMRLHEYYFAELQGGAKPLDPNSSLAQAINETYPSENPEERIKKLLKNIGSMRGPGWAILYWDPKSRQILAGFSGEQHQGHFVTLPIILALDVWEHAYILDYGASGKGKYIDAFFENLNWGVCEENFKNAHSAQ